MRHAITYAMIKWSSRGELAKGKTIMTKLILVAVAAVALAMTIGFAAFGNGASPSEAGGDTDVLIAPTSDTAPIGGEVEAEIRIENGSQVASYIIEIAFDPIVLEIDRIDGGAIGPCADFMPSAGVLHIECGSLDPVSSDSARLFEIEFRGLCAGTSAVTFMRTSR
jgi:hypothetical protein